MPFEGNDPAAFVHSVNFHRRHLTATQKACIGVGYKEQLRNAAAVYKTVRLSEQFSDKAKHLYEVSRAPEEAWPQLCAAIESGVLNTVEDVSKTGGLREYARQMGKDTGGISKLKDAALVYKTVELTPLTASEKFSEAVCRLPLSLSFTSEKFSDLTANRASTTSRAFFNVGRDVSNAPATLSRATPLKLPENFSGSLSVRARCLCRFHLPLKSFQR
jgi:hypothetical protein